MLGAAFMLCLIQAFILGIAVGTSWFSFSRYEKVYSILFVMMPLVAAVLIFIYLSKA